jgi:hypothetical protein
MAKNRDTVISVIQMADTHEWFSVNVWEGFVQAFAGLASFVAVGSGLTAFVAWRDQQTAAEIADAAGLGLAVAFIPGLVFAGVIYVNVATSGLSG